jgi:hypothetical protein
LVTDPRISNHFAKSAPRRRRQSTARLQQATSAAATTLLKVMVDPATLASTRVRAAECVLNHAAKAVEMEDIDARLSTLEQAASRTKA